VTRLAMFPLGTVLFPHAGLPLHVFEPRYRALMHDCLLGERRFGVILIERGSEVGGHDQRFGLGTAARIVEAAELPDGRWIVTVLGTHRVKVEQWLPDAPYPCAEVEELSEPPWDKSDDSYLEEAARRVRRALAYASELGQTVAAATVDLADAPEIAAWQLAAVAPLGPADKQRLLEATGHGERLRVLAAMADEEAELLAYRLGGG
jgi:Lon protease-like protein